VEHRVRAGFHRNFSQAIPPALSWPNRGLTKRTEGELSVGGPCREQMPTATRKVLRSPETACCRKTSSEEPAESRTLLTVPSQHPAPSWTEAQGCRLCLQQRRVDSHKQRSSRQNALPYQALGSWQHSPRRSPFSFLILPEAEGSPRSLASPLGSRAGCPAEGGITLHPASHCPGTATHCPPPPPGLPAQRPPP